MTIGARRFGIKSTGVSSGSITFLWPCCSVFIFWMRATPWSASLSRSPAVSPFNERAGGEVTDWQKYREPTRDYDETVFNVVPYGDENGETLAVLHNAAGDLGVSLGFNIQQLPVFSLWKNTDTMGQGYVTGLEPGTSWAYNRSYQRALNRVPTIGPKEQRRFDITYTFLADKSAVDSALQQVQKIQHDRPTEVRKSPLVELPKKLASICRGTCGAGRLWRTRSGSLPFA
jgi:Domain of unknown function (DUF4432)